MFVCISVQSLQGFAVLRFHMIPTMAIVDYNFLLLKKIARSLQICINYDFIYLKITTIFDSRLNSVSILLAATITHTLARSWWDHICRNSRRKLKKQNSNKKTKQLKTTKNHLQLVPAANPTTFGCNNHNKPFHNPEGTVQKTRP